MRKTISTFVASLVLVALVVGPAAAAPNKKSYEWTARCGTDAPFTIFAPLGAPGWPLLAKSPVLLEGGTFTVTTDGVSETFVDPVPAGLVSRVRECSIEGPVGMDPDVFHVSSHPGYLLFTG